ncbi:hypothetical protein BKA58DRAFT_462244 [Alternaria rosae]|uniref:uncharacterized protein n=1 Tax=Alternaria rosae TaxID=1187941 RepID=UPI001E8E1358|nr:uncharacterized protein BKA58DRAFT_462244 [Alternaria rosae]KAH6864801.1 hypothetical protein BKA58DRAFT_462244 [Alternaria rosae]
MTPNFTIACGVDSYTVDLDVIAPYSEYFRRATRFGKEASEGTITLHDDEPAIISLMIEFLHEGDYDATSWKIDARAGDLTWIRSYGNSPYASSGTINQNDPCSGDESSGLPYGAASLATVEKRQRVLQGMPKGSGRALYHTPTPRHMLLHLQLWEVADKYLVPDLQALCTKRFNEAAEYYHPHPEMIDAILWVYEDLPEHAGDLREAVFLIVVEHPELLDGEAVRESSPCQDLRDAVASRGLGQTEWVFNRPREVWPYIS